MKQFLDMLYFSLTKIKITSGWAIGLDVKTDYFFFKKGFLKAFKSKIILSVQNATRAGRMYYTTLGISHRRHRVCG